MKPLTSLDLRSLAADSGLSDATIASMGIEHLDRDDLVSILERDDFVSGESGFKIPYWDRHGNPTKEFNIRLHHGVPNAEGKNRKYLRPVGSEAPLYFPPGVQALLGAEDYVIVTEGEKKAAKAVQEGIPCIAIAGVWNWVDPEARKKEKEEDINVSFMTPPLPDLLDLARTKKIILAFDSDASSNHQVRKALYLLTDSLLYHVNGWVQILEVPGQPGCPDVKWGIDDWMVQDPQGVTNFKAEIQNKLKAPGLKMLPLIMFRYGTSSTGKALYYRVPNCPLGENINIHNIYKDVEEMDAQGAALVRPKKICGSRLWISRTIWNVDDNSQKYEISYIPVSGNQIKTIHGGGELITFTAKGTAELYASMGVPILGKERADMEEFLRDCLTYGTRNGNILCQRGTQRRGWTELHNENENERNVYVFPHRVIEANRKTSKRSANVNLIPIEASAIESKDQFSSKGDEALWRETMRNYIVPTNLPLMYVSASLAGMLRYWTNSENFIFHIYAESSKGKTNALLAAESIWGDPEQLEIKWRMTDNGLESRCIARNDMALFLDEAGQGDENVIRNSVYMIGNATEKVRASRDGSERRSKKFRLVALSSGERAILRGSRHAGQEVRVLDVPIYALGSFWERTINTAEVADKVKNIFKNNYGWGAEKAIQRVLAAEKEHPGYWMALHAAYTESLRNTLDKKKVPQHIVRRANHYGLILTAMTLLLEVLECDQNTIDDRLAEVSHAIAENLLQTSADQFGAGETAGMLEEFTNALASQRSSHFFYNGEKPRMDMWGSVTTEDNQPKWFYIIPAYMQKLCGEFDSARIVQMLDSIGALSYNKNSAKKDKKKSCRIDGQTVSCYVVDIQRIQEYQTDLVKNLEAAGEEEEA